MSKCDCCSNFVFDDESGYYECVVSLDEDEMAKFLLDRFQECPYFMFNDEYALARKQ